MLKKLLLLLVTTLLLFTGCSQLEEENESQPVTEEKNINTAVKSISRLPTDEEGENESEKEREIITEDGERFEIITTEHSITDNSKNFMLYNPQASMLWPGNLIQGAGLNEDGSLNDIPLKRQPIKVSLNILSGSDYEKSKKVDNPTYSSINDAANEILHDYDGGTPGKYKFDYTEIESLEHLEYELGADFVNNFSFGAEFEQEKYEDKSILMVTLDQEFFTFVMDPPNDPDEVFTDEVEAEDLNPYLGKGNPPMYIDSITYGRKYYLVYRSTASKNELKAAIDFSFGLVDDLGGKGDYKDIMNKTEVEIYQVGGNARTGLDTTTARPNSEEEREELQKFIKEATFDKENIGLPMSFTARYLKDSTFAKLSNTFEYTVKEKVPLGPEIIFEDEELEKIIREKTGISEGDIEYNQAKDIQTIDASENDIKSLEGIQHLDGLEELNLDYNNIDNLSYLGNLENLEKLYLKNNNVDDVTALQNLKNLRELDLEDNDITNISKIAGLSDLEKLNLNNNNCDVNDLDNLPALRQLNFSGNGITNIDNLSEFDDLRHLNLSNNQISDINNIVDLDKLNTLNLRDNNLKTLEPLKKLNNISNIDLRDMEFDGETSDVIRKLKDDGVSVMHDELSNKYYITGEIDGFTADKIFIVPEPEEKEAFKDNEIPFDMEIKEDVEGKFEFEVPRGVYRVVATKEGYVPKEYVASTAELEPIDIKDYNLETLKSTSGKIKTKDKDYIKSYYEAKDLGKTELDIYSGSKPEPADMENIYLDENVTEIYTHLYKFEGEKNSGLGTNEAHAKYKFAKGKGSNYLIEKSTNDSSSYSNMTVAEIGKQNIVAEKSYTSFNSSSHEGHYTFYVEGDRDSSAIAVTAFARAGFKLKITEIELSSHVPQINLNHEFGEHSDSNKIIEKIDIDPNVDYLNLDHKIKYQWFTNTDINNFDEIDKKQKSPESNGIQYLFVEAKDDLGAHKQKILGPFLVNN